MSIQGVSAAQLAKASASDIKGLIASRENMVNGYNAGINNPNEKNDQTKAIFKANKGSVSQEIAELKEILSKKESQPNQVTAQSKGQNPQGNNQEQLGQKLFYLA